MVLRYALLRVLLSSGLLSTALASHAQLLAADSAAQPKPAALLPKVGLRITHLRYTRNSQAWQILLPLSLGAEYRLAPSFSLYTQFEADLQATSAAVRRRQTRAAVLSGATLGLGLRYYYDHRRHIGPEFGNYLALEGLADWAQVTASYTSSRRRTTPAVLTPALYAFWGTQHRFRAHLLYDLNAGLGVLAPAQYSFEHLGTASHWDVGAQVNVRLYIVR